MTITLKAHGFEARAATRGGELTSFRADGREYIWQADPAYWANHNPTLFPIVGGLKDGAVRMEGKTYRMGRHGFTRGSEFTLAETGDGYAVFTLSESPETLSQYPYPFLLSIRHQLTEKGFRTTFTVRNTGDAPLPFCIGGHTAFRCPLEEGERFEDYRLVFEKKETADSLLILPNGCLDPVHTAPDLRDTDTIALTRAPFDERDTLIYQGLQSKTVALRHKDTGRGVKMDFSQFPMLAFWTPPHKNAPFICIEPWQGCSAFDNESGEFTGKPHCILLPPGEEKSLGYWVEIL